MGRSPGNNPARPSARKWQRKSRGLVARRGGSPGMRAAMQRTPPEPGDGPARRRCRLEASGYDFAE